MTSRLIRWLTVATITFALGGHLAVLQSIAWVTMVARYSQTEPIKMALSKTFDGKHPCPICKFVAKEKKSGEKQETQSLLAKLDFFLASSQVSSYPPTPDSIRSGPARTADARSETPPTPPPRTLPG